MQVIRKSILSGKENTLEINCTQEQLDEYAKGKGLVQSIFPNLSDDDREFIMTGITKEEWDIEIPDE